MRAISCMTCAIVLCVASSLSGTASADSVDKPAVNDKPVVKKAPKRSASKAKPDKNLVLASVSDPAGSDAQF